MTDGASLGALLMNPLFVAPRRNCANLTAPMPDDRKVLSDASQPTGQGDRVVMLRPRKGVSGGRAPRLSVIDPQHDPAWLREQRTDQAGELEAEVDKEKDGQEEDDADYRYRMLTNLIGVALIAVLIGTGVWLAHAIADMRKTQDCVLSGRRNCAPIELPSSSR